MTSNLVNSNLTVATFPNWSCDAKCILGETGSGMFHHLRCSLHKKRVFASSSLRWVGNIRRMCYATPWTCQLQRLSRVVLDMEWPWMLMALSMAFCVSVFHLAWKWTVSRMAFYPDSSQASVGRLGPLQVSVERHSPKLPELQKAKGMAWWIGTRWAVAKLTESHRYN